jgi:hypothetical protein
MSDPTNLVQYQWKNRLLLLFAPNTDDAAYQAQLEALSQRNPNLVAPGLDDRDMVVFYVLTEQGSLEHAGQHITLSSQQITSLRSQFDVPRDTFTLLLIGKDGGIKRHENHAVAVETLFAQIDSMPMRQREMR